MRRRRNCRRRRSVHREAKPRTPQARPGATPIIVLPAVSKLAVVVNGMPTLAAAFAAARISSSADMVSIQITSAPPSLRPSICSTKTSTASSSVSGPSGAKRSPVGPTEPATTTGRPAASATARAFSAARRFSSRVRSSRLCSISRRRLAPKELVRMMSAPASTKLWWSARIVSRWVSFHSSGESPEVRPMLNRFVPVAPSARSTGCEARSDSSDVRMATPCRAEYPGLDPGVFRRDIVRNSVQFEFGQRDRERRLEQRYQPFARRQIGDGAVAGGRRVAVDASL